MKALLGPDVILGSLGSVVSLPGAEDQKVHQDLVHIFDVPEVPEADPVLLSRLPAYAITMIVPLVPLNPINGTTRMWPGSHRVPAQEARGRFPSVDPLAATGECLLMDYRLLHGGTANVSEAVRPILYLVYYRPWFRDYSNFGKQDPIQISEDEYARIPVQYQHMFGWIWQGARAYVRQAPPMGVRVRRGIRRRLDRLYQRLSRIVRR